MSSSENKDLLGKMFSSFVARKTRMTSPPAPTSTPPLPPVLLPPPPRGEKRARTSKPGSSGSRGSGKSSRVSASTRERERPRRTVANSVRPGASQTSVEAIATDSTSTPKPFHCEKCSSAFRQKSQLSRHFLRVHEKQKPYACSHCDKCFASAFDRKRHVEAVHGRRCIEFFCDRCPFRAKVEGDLMAHIRTVHERDRCRLCGKQFKRAANLLAHERHYHRGMQ